LHREPEEDVIPKCLRSGLAFIPYFPLASGLLTGKYRLSRPAPKGSRLESRFGTGPFTNENLELVEALLAFAASRRHHLGELAISWLAARPAVASVIAGATSPEQVTANAAAPRWQLTDAELQEVDAILSRSVHESDSYR
jgi:aryl-alcohol dehydrogenase-like predicted oxidoreductase